MINYLIYKYKFFWILSILLLGNASYAAEWVLLPERSAISYLSTKLPVQGASLIFESNLFRDFSGTIDDSDFKLMIDLKSLDTRIPIRDERIAEHVFLTSQYPEAVVTASLEDLDQLELLLAKRVSAQLAMRGKTNSVTAELILNRGDKDTLIIQTSTPVLVDARAYGMLEGFGELEKLAGLSYIPTTIPVSLYLVFMKS